MHTVPTALDHTITRNRALEAACADVRRKFEDPASPVFYFAGPFGMGGQRKSDPTPFQTAADYVKRRYSVYRNGAIRQMTVDEQVAWFKDGALPGDDLPLQMAAE